MMEKEQSFVMIKPDAMQRSLIGEIVKRIERTGLKLVAMKMVVPDRERLIEHYGKDDEWYEKKGKLWIENIKAEGGTPEMEAIDYGKKIIEGSVYFLSSGPCVQMVWEGNQAVGIIKKIVGGTEPLTSDPGTIRGDYTLDSYPMANRDSRAVRNLLHCTGEAHESEFEINIWFDKSEIMDYRQIQEAMLYDVNLDGILE